MDNQPASGAVRAVIAAWCTLEAEQGDALSAPAYLAARQRVIAALDAEQAPLTAAECDVVAQCQAAADTRWQHWRAQHASLGGQLQKLRLARQTRQGDRAAPPTISRFS